jgi:hypothetical protein
MCLCVGMRIFIVACSEAVGTSLSYSHLSHPCKNSKEL